MNAAIIALLTLVIHDGGNMILTDTLRAQHVAVVALVKDLDLALLGNDAAGVQRVLGQLKIGLLAHLALEDGQLYPALIEAARRTDPAQVQVAEVFSANMSRISDALVRFLGRHEGKALDLPRVENEWKTIREVLAARVASEEQTLYPLYERLVAQRPVGKAS